MKELNHLVLEKKPLRFSKSAPFLYKRALRQSRGAGGGQTPQSEVVFEEFN